MTTAIELLAKTVGRHAPADGELLTAIPFLQFYRTSRPTTYAGVIYEPSLCVVVQGSKEIILSGETYQYDAAQSLLVSVDLPVNARVVEATPTKPNLVVRIALNPAVVAELLVEGTAVSSNGSSVRGVGLTTLDPAVLDAVSRLVTLLDSPADIGALAPLILREITYRLLAGPQGLRLRQIAAAGAPAQRIARAIRWLRDHYRVSMRVDSLAKQVRMSPSAFHLHFKGMTAMSPLQYQKRLRLQEARRLMLGEGLDASAAAYRVGYESPSQFSREYRRMFGASPRRDVAVGKGLG